ncbi:MAG: ABC transporter substrate-binding protein [Spirochaetaceae bacterium]|nr:ABC transporter substrate-binding protein [Spirochaetaceae bacterium]
MKKNTIIFLLSILFTSMMFPSGQNEEQPLKIAFLPVLDSLPFYIALEEGYFAEEGLAVQAIPVSSPVERDQLMQAGEIDGMLNELSSTALFNRDEIQVQTVQIVRIATGNSPVFRILASPQSGITIPAELAGIEIGVSKNSVIEYLTDRILQKEGLSDNEISVKSVPLIPERFQLLMSGQISAATLPDPLAQAAVAAGAVEVIADTAYPQYSVSVLSFSRKSIEENRSALNKFMKAWNKAVLLLNEDPDAYRALFLEKIPVPPTISDAFIIPPFASPGLPGEEQWNDVLDWLEEKGLMSTRPSFDKSVDNL